MAKKSTPRMGQQTKTSAKGAHGGGIKFSQVSLGPGFKNITGKGINAGKAAAKLPQPKKNISETTASNAPRVMLGKGFTESPKVPPAIKTQGGEKMFFDSKSRNMPCTTPGRKIRSGGKGRGLARGKGRGPIGRRGK